MLPLSENNDQNEEELFNLSDVRIEVMRSRGAGGQVGLKTVVKLYNILTFDP